MTYDMLDAAVVNFGYTEVVKVAAGMGACERAGPQVVPVGAHVDAFALAAVAERHYGWKIGVPAYLVAGLVGASVSSRTSTT